MYKLREQRLREMVQNDEESLGTLSTADDGTVTERTETTITVGSDGEGMTTTTTRRSSNIEVRLVAVKEWGFGVVLRFWSCLIPFG